MANESTNLKPTCHPNGSWVVAANGQAFCSVCGRGLNAPLPEAPAEPKTVKEVFVAEAVRDPLLTEREKTHGSFKRNAAVFHRLTDAIRPDEANALAEDQHLALVMMMVKLSRALQNPKVKEHWDDMAGYAKLAAEACSE